MPANVSALLKLPSDEAFKQWLAVPGEWVEEPNVRRGGQSGVKRIMTTDGKMLYRKQQVGHTFRSLKHPFGYPTCMRESVALKACAERKVIAPLVVYSDCQKIAGTWHALLVTESLDGFSSLEDCYARGDEQQWGDELHQRIAYDIGCTLARYNLGRWQHGALRTKHVFVRILGDKVETAVLDLEKSRRRLTTIRAARHDIGNIQHRFKWADNLWEAFFKGYKASFGDQFKRI
jgi:hypothetical protein